MELFYVAISDFYDKNFVIRAKDLEEFLSKLYTQLPGFENLLYTNEFNITFNSDNPKDPIILEVWDVFITEDGQITDERMFAYTFRVYVLSENSPDILNIA